MICRMHIYSFQMYLEYRLDVHAAAKTPKSPEGDFKAVQSGDSGVNEKSICIKFNRIRFRIN